MKVTHPNLYTFLGRLQRATADSETEIARLNPGMSIRRCKKRTTLVNDARIKSCIARYDSGAYTRVQFLRAVSHSTVGVHAVPAAATDASDTDDDDDRDVSVSNQLQPVCPVSAPPSQDMCEVCLIEQRDARLAFVPCGHQRFCASCVAYLEQQARVRDYHGSASLLYSLTVMT